MAEATLEDFLAPKKAKTGIREQQGFQFLNVTGSSKLDELSRMAVRVQSLRDYHQKRREQASSKRSSDDTRQKPMLEHAPRAKLLRFRLGSQELKPTQKQPQPAYVLSGADKKGPKSLAVDHPLVEDPNNIDLEPENSARSHHLVVFEWSQHGNLESFSKVIGGWLDPFDSLPLPSTPKIRTLINQLMIRITSNSPTTDYRRAWFEFAVQDLAFFYTALCQSAADTDLTLRKGDTPDALLYKGKAIALLNERIGCPSLKLTDATIGTVAALASYELSNGSLDAVSAHMNGLELMVQMRGGLNNPSFSTKIRRLVLWVDLSVASLWNTTPRFSCNANSCWTPSPITDIPLEKNELPTSFGMFPVNPSLSFATISKLFADLRLLAALKTSNKFLIMQGDNEISYGDRAYCIQRQLMELTSDDSFEWFTTIDITCALAALIYVHHCLFDTSLESRVVESLVDRLNKSIRLIVVGNGNIVLLDAREDVRVTVLWSIIVGGIASGAKLERTNFVNTLMSFHSRFFTNEGFALGLQFRDLLWDAHLETGVCRLWTEVEKAKGNSYSS